MTGTDGAVRGDEDIEALREVARGIAARKRKDIAAEAMLFVVVAGLFGGALLVAGIQQGAPIAFALAAGVVLLCAWFGYEGVSQAVSDGSRKRAMPILAGMVEDLDYASGARTPADLRQAGLLPPGSALGRDEVSGHLGERAFRSWQVTVTQQRQRTKGGSTTIAVFSGMIVEVETPGAPDLRVARQGLIERIGGVGGPGETVVEHEGERYAARLPKDATSSDLRIALEAAQAAMPPGSVLEGVLQSEGRAWLVLVPGRPLYRMGGAFSNADTLMEEAREALGDLLVGGRIAAAWAEQGLAKGA